jgi:hypothetical protein
MRRFELREDSPWVFRPVVVPPRDITRQEELDMFKPAKTFITTGGASIVRRVLITCVAAGAVLTPCAAQADVTFSDGVVAHTEVHCNSVLHEIGDSYFFRGGTGYVWTYAYSDRLKRGNWFGPREISGLIVDGNAGTEARGWMAYYVYYAHAVNGQWQTGGEWVAVVQDGNQSWQYSPWCYV